MFDFYKSWAGQSHLNPDFGCIPRLARGWNSGGDEQDEEDGFEGGHGILFIFLLLLVLQEIVVVKGITPYTIQNRTYDRL